MAALSDYAPRYVEATLSTQQAATVSTDLTYEAYRTATRWVIGCFRHDQDNKIYGYVEFSNKQRRPKTDIVIQLQVIPLVDPAAAKNIIFNCNYSWTVMGEEIPAPAGWTAVNPKITWSINSGDEFKPHEILIVTISPPAADTFDQHNFLCFEIIRPGSSDGDDTYEAAKAVGTSQANVGLLSMEVYYQTDRRGSESL